MGIKTYKPTTSGMRWVTVPDFNEITKTTPEKSLTVTKKKTGGRNFYGRITSRGIGGGHKQKIRIIDFKRNKRDVQGEVIAIEYDPMRSSRIALIKYPDGEKRYIIAPADLKVTDKIVASKEADIKSGNALPLASIPAGIPIHNIETRPGSGGKIARTAGGEAVIMAKEGAYAHLRMPSGEIKLIPLDCWATVGQVGNIDHEAISIGKAGRNRYRGIRPLSRAVAKNPVDHPMGGGEGKSSGGRHPCSPWGQLAKGLKTRKSKTSDKFILKRRK